MSRKAPRKHPIRCQPLEAIRRENQLQKVCKPSLRSSLRPSGAQQEPVMIPGRRCLRRTASSPPLTTQGVEASLARTTCTALSTSTTLPRQHLRRSLFATPSAISPSWEPHHSSEILWTMPVPNSETNSKAKRLFTQVRGGWPQVWLTIAIVTLQMLPPSSASDLKVASTQAFKVSVHNCHEAEKAARIYRKPPVLQQLPDRKEAREVRGARTRSMMDNRQSPLKLRRKNCHRS